VTESLAMSVSVDGIVNRKTSPRVDRAANVSSQLVILAMGGLITNGCTYFEKSESSGIGNLDRRTPVNPTSHEY
jgi:hypothetical protein